MNESYYYISEMQLRDLLKHKLRLVALEISGVDNWPWYYDSLNGYLKENDYTSYPEMAHDLLKDFKKVESDEL